MEHKVFLNYVTGSVYCMGEYTPTSYEKKSVSKPENLILIVPGMPGFADNYCRFAEQIYRHLKTTIWIAGYAGLSTGAHSPDILTERQYYNMEGQIQHKKELFRTYLRTINVYVVSHSYGCAMTLELMRDPKIAEMIKKAYFIFPCIQNLDILDTPFDIKRTAENLLWAYQKFRWLLRPVVRNTLVQTVITRICCHYMRRDKRENYHFSAYINIDILHIIGLNLESIARGRPYQLDLQQHVSKIRLYYAEDDVWAPKMLGRDLRDEIRDLDVKWDWLGTPHEFILSHCGTIADLVANWLQDQIKIITK